MNLKSILHQILFTIPLIYIMQGAFASGHVSGHVSGELGTWLHHNAGPRLSSLINKQPRFIGESIQIVALEDGRPVEIDNELASRIQGLLRKELLDKSTIRIPLQSSNACQLRDVNIVLGIEISRQNRYEHQILLALLDIEENVWINRSAQLWVGRLNTHQKQLLSKPTSSMTPAAFHVSQTAGIAASFAAQLKCSPPFAAPVYIATEDVSLRQELRREFSRTMTLTDDRQEAETVLNVRQNSDTELGLHLVTDDQPIPVARVQLKAVTTQKALLSEIKLAEKKTECRGHGKHCVDINYEVFEDAYVFEFYTKQGKMAPLSCEIETSPRYGVTSHGLKVRPTETLNRPSLGYYVLATRNPGAAQEIAATLKSGSGRCSTLENDNWTANLSDVIDRYNIDWRALHLINTRGHIRAL